MKTITMFVTFDGVKHDSLKSALNYLSAMYADKLSRLSAKLLQDGNCKHIATGDFIDNNLHLFAELQKIKDDFDMSKDEENPRQAVQKPSY